MTRFLVFKGSSQYDVLSSSAVNYVRSAQNLGFEVALIDMNIINNKDYLKIVEKFNPDFTLGFNPVGFIYEGKWHMEKTGIPHILQLGDSPYHHIFNRVLEKPDSNLVHTMVFENEYVNDFLDFNSRNVSFKPFLSVDNFMSIPLGNKIYPLVYFGSYTSEKNVLDWARQYLNNPTIFKLVEELLINIKGFIENNLTILPERLPIYIRAHFLEKLNCDEQLLNRVSLVVFPVVDRYYNSIIRGKVLTEFAKSGIDMYVFGREDTEALLSEYSNVRVFPPVGYLEHLSIVTHSLIHLNITPTKFSMHERVSNSLANSTLLCTNIMPNLFENYPEILESSIVYDLSNIQETANVLREIINDINEYEEIINKGMSVAKREFNFKKDIDYLLDTYNGKFVKGIK